MLLRLFVPLIAISILACQPTAAQPTDPAGVMDAYTKAINAGSIDGALAFVDENAVYDRPGGQYKGRTEVRGFIKDLVDQKAKVELIGSRNVQGERVTWQSRVTLTNAQGQATTVQNQSESIIRNGKIVMHKATRVP